MLQLARFASLALALGACVAAHAEDWRYEKSVDRMTSKTVSSADLVSANTLSLGFPYQGTNYGQLTVRDKPGQGTTALLVIKKGQILCHSYQCDIQIRFDDAPPVKFGGDHPADNSSNAVFLANAGKFITRAKTAKKILVEFTAYNQGNQILEFAPSTSLAWPMK
jgi:hypothetical protein